MRKGVIFPEPQKDEVTTMTTPPPKIPKDTPPTRRQVSVAPVASSSGSSGTGGTVITAPKFKDPDCMAAISVAELLVSIIMADGSNLLDEMPISLLANVRNGHAVCLKRITNYANTPGSFPEVRY
jgi:hypothetical protein